VLAVLIIPPESQVHVAYFLYRYNSVSARADKAYVESNTLLNLTNYLMPSIYHYAIRSNIISRSRLNPSFTYTVGQMVYPDHFYNVREKYTSSICESGIHYLHNQQAAGNY